MRTAIIWTCVVLVVIPIVIAHPLTNDSAADWPMFRRDAAQTGTVGQLVQGNGSILWIYNTTGFVSADPVFAQGHVLIASTDHRLYSLDAYTGRLEWTFVAEGTVVSPAISNNRVFVGSEDHNLYALDLSTGEKLWQFRTDDMVFATPAVKDDRLYFASRDGVVYCLDAATGGRVWEFRSEEGGATSGIIQGNKMFLGAGEYSVYALDVETGQPVWSQRFSWGSAQAPAILGDRLVAASNAGLLRAFDAKRGSELWNFTAPSTVPSFPVTWGGLVFVYSWANVLQAIDLSTGKEVWAFRTGDAPAGSIGTGIAFKGDAAPAVLDGVVFLASWDGHLYAINAYTGKELWNLTLPQSGFSSATVVGGIVYVAAGRSLYAISSPIGPQAGPAGTTPVSGNESPSVPTSFVIMALAIALSGTGRKLGLVGRYNSHG